jgi:hypothetical protein
VRLWPRSYFTSRKKTFSPEGNPEFRADIIVGGSLLVPTDVWFYEAYFVLMGWRKGTRFDYSQISKIEETKVTWGRGPIITKLCGWVYLVDSSKPFCVILAPRGHSRGSRKLNEQIEVELPKWLEQKLGDQRYIKMTEQLPLNEKRTS